MRSTTRVDMHCHSTASQVSKLGVQRALGLPECATPPQEVYELAKRRGMDFVTITDHDTIAGAMEIADRPDVFVSEELTASFKGEPQQVHVLCYGIAPEDHEWLQAHSHDVELCATYLREREIACALAHPYYAVGAPLTSRHRRRLAELFDVWETRNGSRAHELNRPAATYVATRDGTGIGGSDDHAGIDIGRTYTEAPAAATPAEFLGHVRAGDVEAKGKQGSATKWAHAAIALAARSLWSEDLREAPAGPDPRRVMRMAQRLLSEGDARHGATGADLTPEDARCLLRAWLIAVELDHLDERGLIEHMQQDGFSHSELYRRACRLHERKLRAAVEQALEVAGGEAVANRAGGGTSAGARAGGAGGGGTGDGIAAAASRIFESCIAVIPYAPATAFLANEQRKLDDRREDGEPPRVAIVADGIGSTHGVSRTIEEIRSRGVPGYEIEVVATDPHVDRRLSAVSELDVPFYPGLRIGVPSLSAAAQTLTESQFDAIHVCSPGPAGIAGVLLAKALGLPLIGSYHTELTAYAQLRSERAEVAAAMQMAVGAFYNACDLVLSPSPASDEALTGAGLAAEKIVRWDRGVDSARFDPSMRSEDVRETWGRAWQSFCPNAGSTRTAKRPSEDGRGSSPLYVLYAGRITREKGIDLLAQAFLAAHAQDERLRLVLAGGGPEQERMAERLGGRAVMLGWLHGEELARAYASADAFLFCSQTDTFGQVILEAQASGLPVVAVDAGGPRALIEDGVSGRLCKPDARALAGALLELAAAPLRRERLASAALSAVRGRSWERALGRLANGYDIALGARASEKRRAA